MWSFIKIFLILYKSDKRKISQEKTCHGAAVIILAHFDLKLNSNRQLRKFIFLWWLSSWMEGWTVLSNTILKRNKIYLSFNSLGKSYLSFKRRRFKKNWPIRNKNCLWWPCLLMNRDEMSNLYRGTSKDALYQVSIYLAKRFQRRRFFLEINQSETRMACGGHVC